MCRLGGTAYGLPAKEKQKQLVEAGMASSMDEAAHMLADMGEINSTEHAELLSKAERKKVYGE